MNIDSNTVMSRYDIYDKYCVSACMSATDKTKSIQTFTLFDSKRTMKDPIESGAANPRQDKAQV